MIFVKVNGTMYPAEINGRMIDTEWDNRESKAITVEMDYATAAAIFVDGIAWSIVQTEELPVFEKNEDGEVVQVGTEIHEQEYDNSDFNVAGDIVDHRNGSITAKMGKPTQTEILERQLANAITEEELSAAYEEGVNSL